MNMEGLSNDELYDIVKTSKSKNIRYKAIRRITDEKMLVDIALNSTHMLMRKTAIENENLKNQEVLTQIVLNDKIVSIRIRAVEKVYDENLLMNIAMNEKREKDMYGYFCGNNELLFLALDKLDLNDENIRKPLLEGAHKKMMMHILKNVDNLDSIKDEFVERLDEINYGDWITDEKELWILAKYSSDSLKRDLAVLNSNFKDEDLLYDVIKNCQRSKFDHVRREACKKITNVDYLIDIAINDPFKKNRNYAERKVCEITGDKTLIQNIRNNNPEARLSKLSGIDDEQALIDIAKHDSHINVRKAAIDKIDDEETLVDIARNDEWCVSDLAMDKIEDEQTLIDIYNNTKDFKIKKNVIRHIDNPIFLAKVAKDPNDNRMAREYAASRITSQKTLRDIAINSTREVGIAAVDNPHLKKDTYLYEIILKTKITYVNMWSWGIERASIKDNVRIHAIWKLNDKKLLKRLLQKNLENPKFSFAIDSVEMHIKNRLKELE